MQFLQKIFLRLDDPDSVDGCNSRRVGTLPFTSVYSFTRPWVRSRRRCCAAPKRSSITPGLLTPAEVLQTSMNNFDQSEQVYTYGCSLMHGGPSGGPVGAVRHRSRLEVRRLAPIGANGRPNTRSTCLTTFGSCVGDLFSSIITRKESDLRGEAAELAQRTGRPLSAAAIEISATCGGNEYVIDCISE